MIDHKWHATKFRSLRNLQSSDNLFKSGLIVAAGIMLLGGALFAANTSWFGFEAEQGSISGDASAADMALASGGKGVEFGPATLNNIDRVVNSMKGNNEAYPHNLPSGFDWAFDSSVYIPASTDKYNLMTLQGIAYGAANGPGQPYQAFPANSKVQMRNMRIYILSNKDNRWKTLISSDGSQARGRAYPEDYSGAPAIHFEFDREASGGSAANMFSGRNLVFDVGFYTNIQQVTGLNPATDIAGIFATMQARLVVDDPAQPDDSNAAKVILYTAAEYWQDGIPYCGWKCSNELAAIGKAMYLSSDWQSFNMHTLSEAAIRANPPPLE